MLLIASVALVSGVLLSVIFTARRQGAHSTHRILGGLLAFGLPLLALSVTLPLWLFLAVLAYARYLPVWLAGAAGLSWLAAIVSCHWTGMQLLRQTKEQARKG
jgi:hypothetical protein